jgi:hypothetical protein
MGLGMDLAGDIGESVGQCRPQQPEHGGHQAYHGGGNQTVFDGGNAVIIVGKALLR